MMTKQQRIQMALGEIELANLALAGNHPSVALECVQQAEENLKAYDYAPGTPVSDEVLERVVDVVQLCRVVTMTRRGGPKGPEGA